MDGEDAGVLLPYAEIREALRLGRGSLGNVKVAKLVLMGKKTDLGSAIWGDIDLTPEFKVVGVKGLLYVFCLLFFLKFVEYVPFHQPA